MKKIICALIVGALLFSGGITVYASSFGTGMAVSANGVTLIKTGLLGQKLCFSDADFKSAFAITDFDTVTVTKLPSSLEGTLLLAGRRVKEGQTIKRKNIAAMVFVPRSTEVTQASFSFTLDKGSGIETVCQMKFIDKINYAPKTAENTETSLSVTTQAEISVYGKMDARDPEGDALEFIIVSYPKNGVLSLTDKQSGKYKYTPRGDFTGYDKFSYVARDEYGNYSGVQTVGIRIIERMSSEVFVDMTNRSEYNAAVAISAMGVMSGKTVGDDSYFMPEESVTRAEFVAMAMKAYGIRKDTTIERSFFDDDGDIPDSLVGYVATAQRVGIIDGSFGNDGLVFNPNEKITRYDAAKIMARILGVSDSVEDEEFFDNTTAPVYAKSSIESMITLGIFDCDKEAEDFSAYVNRAEAAEYLYRMISVNV